MEFALAANDAMGNVVAIAEDDCRPGFHCELLWREGEIIDVHLHVRRANGHCRNGGESGGDKKCAGAAPGYLVAWRLCEACLDVEAASIMLFE